VVGQVCRAGIGRRADEGQPSASRRSLDRCDVVGEGPSDSFEIGCGLSMGNTWQTMPRSGKVMGRSAPKKCSADITKVLYF